MLVCILFLLLSLHHTTHASSLSSSSFLDAFSLSTTSPCRRTLSTTLLGDPLEACIHLKEAQRVSLALAITKCHLESPKPLVSTSELTEHEFQIYTQFYLEVERICSEVQHLHRIEMTKAMLMRLSKASSSLMTSSNEVLQLQHAMKEELGLINEAQVDMLHVLQHEQAEIVHQWDVAQQTFMEHHRRHFEEVVDMFARIDDHQQATLNRIISMDSLLQEWYPLLEHLAYASQMGWREIAWSSVFYMGLWMLGGCFQRRLELRGGLLVCFLVEVFVLRYWTGGTLVLSQYVSSFRALLVSLLSFGLLLFTIFRQLTLSSSSPSPPPLDFCPSDLLLLDLPPHFLDLHGKKNYTHNPYHFSHSPFTAHIFTPSSSSWVQTQHMSVYTRSKSLFRFHLLVVWRGPYGRVLCPRGLWMGHLWMPGSNRMKFVIK